MSLCGALLKRAAVCARHHLRLPSPAPIPCQALKPAAALQRCFFSGLGDLPPKPRDTELAPKPRDTELENLPPKLRHHPHLEKDLQNMLDKFWSTGNVQMLPYIAEQIIFRRMTRWLKRFNSHPNDDYCVYLTTTVHDPNEVLPQKVDGKYCYDGKPIVLGDDGIVRLGDEPFLLKKHPKRVLYFFKFLENETAKEPEPDASKWKDLFQEYRPSCYSILSSRMKRTYVRVAAELGDMCLRGEIKGEEAYELLKHIGEDMRSYWERYDTGYLM